MTSFLRLVARTVFVFGTSSAVVRALSVVRAWLVVHSGPTHVLTINRVGPYIPPSVSQKKNENESTFFSFSFFFSQKSETLEIFLSPK